MPKLKHKAYGRSVVRTCRFTEEQWAEVQARADKLRMPPARFVAYAVLKALDRNEPELASAAAVSALIDGAV
jgi:hypothetical protein